MALALVEPCHSVLLRQKCAMIFKFLFLGGEVGRLDFVDAVV